MKKICFFVPVGQAAWGEQLQATTSYARATAWKRTSSCLTATWTKSLSTPKWRRRWASSTWNTNPVRGRIPGRWREVPNAAKALGGDKIPSSVQHRRRQRILFWVLPIQSLAAWIRIPFLAHLLSGRVHQMQVLK